MDKDNAKSIHKRLAKIAGQLNAIDKMIDSDVACVDILIQINAAKSALHKVGQIVLENHVNHCVKSALDSGNIESSLIESSLDELAKAIEHFSRI